MMKKLDAYIAKTILLAIAFVTLLLIGLQMFILFVNELESFGRGHYDAWTAIVYVLLKMPNEVYMFFPVASLLGCLIGLGVMANHRELVVMQAAGKSISQITFAVLKVAILVVVLMTFLGELFIPHLSNFANDVKMQALSEGQALRTEQGVWLRQGNDFINIGTVLPDNHLLNVHQFRFDKSHHLTLARKINSIQYVHGKWIANTIAETQFLPHHTSTSVTKEAVWDVPLQINMLTAGDREADEMTLPELNQYLHIQKKNHQNARQFQLLYWQRIIQPLSTIVMMVLAIPFIFGPLRSSTIGSKLLAGAAVGFSFHILNRIFGPISQVYQWPPEIAAFGPTILFALFGFYMMKRMHS